MARSHAASRYLLTLTASLVLVCAAPAWAAPTRTLTFDERVAAQVAIERVRYAHQRDAPRPFEEAIPASLVREKVLRFLQQTSVLEEVFGTTVTAEMLEQETARIAADTHLPDRLVEIYDALGNDPILVKECFVRPRLVETLLVERFNTDARLHADARALAERASTAIERGEAPPAGLQAWATALRRQDDSESGSNEMEASPGVRVVPPEEYATARSRFPERLSQPGAIEETPSGFQLHIVEEESDTGFRGVTFVAPKLSFSDWWTSVRPRQVPLTAPAIAEGTPLPIAASSATASAGGFCSADGTWESSIAVPAPRKEAVAAWIGDSMLVWGGGGAPGRGDRYFPDTGEWTTFSAEGAPTRWQFWPLPVEMATFWTGQYLLAWSSPPLRYDAAADLWQALSTVGAPSGGVPVWTGTHLIVVAGAASASYDPESDTWQPISSLGAPDNGQAAWTGQDVLVSTGAKYDPATDRWSPISTDGACAGTHALWTGELFLVFRRTWSSSDPDSGCRYDPDADQWSPITAELAFADHVFWTGEKLLALGGMVNDSIAAVAAYDPDTNRWARGYPVIIERYNTAAVWTGTEALLWGGQLEYHRGTTNTGVRVDGNGRLLGPTSLGEIPVGVRHHTLTWTGDEAIAWGGWSLDTGTYTPPYGCTAAGGAFDPALRKWRSMSSSAAPEARGHHTSVWTGNELLVWGGLGSCDVELGGTPLGSGGRYDPLTDSWSPLSATGAPRPRFKHSAVWTGERMIIWGGAAGTTILGDGATYDPNADTWSPVGGAHAPAPRWGHTAVWTGGEMIVWGGMGPSGTALGDGGRLDPSTGAWLPLPLVQAPSPGTGHTAVWTGEEMLIWCGGPSPSYCEGGGRYAVALDAWFPITDVDAPPNRYVQTAVWTGGEMVVSAQASGRYSPATDSWVSVAHPPPWNYLTSSVAVWTGAQMLLWGGTGPADHNETLRDGALLNLGQLADVDGDGASICDGDCDDYDPGRSPDTLEVCDDVDNDCDGVIDNGIGPGMITVSLEPSRLSPANHKLIDVHATVTLNGGCAAACPTPPVVVLTSVTSNEPDDANGVGDGATRNDVQEVTPGIADFDFRLRAERDRRGSGREYQVAYSATDCFGDTTVGYGTVLVPNDPGAQPAPAITGDGGLPARP